MTSEATAAGSTTVAAGVARAAAHDVDPRRVAVVVPCHDEERTIGRVVADFLRELPGADVIVVDNRSTDCTAEVARAAGARVVRETRRGKGYALTRGFEMVADADYLVMVDGDDTYPAAAVHDLLAAAAKGADMVIGTRLTQADAGAFPRGHDFGNRMFILLVRLLFGLRTKDLFSGYRVFSRRFLRIVPLLAQGFEIETELSIQSLVHGFEVVEIPVQYRQRGEGSHSKLRTLHDGARILRALFVYFRDNRPFALFGTLSLVLMLLSLAGGGVVVVEFVRTSFVGRLPLAVLSAALFILSALSFTCGVILSSINRRAAELSALVRRRDPRRSELE